MDDLFGIILFLIFVLAPIIEGIRKQGKGRQPPQRPPSRLPDARPRMPELPQRSQTEEVSGKARDAASVLIPDDLWTILTGEQRPPVLTTPPTAPPRKRLETVYIPPEEAEDEEAVAAEDVNVELARTSREAVQLEHARRHKPEVAISLEVEPEIVSLETGLPSGKARHAAFHDKLIQSEPAAAAARARTSKMKFTDPVEIRRMFILQEVLGKPRGLE